MAKLEMVTLVTVSPQAFQLVAPSTEPRCSREHWEHWEHFQLERSQDRQRWLLVATLERPFELRVPGRRCDVPISAFLDPPDPLRDEADARRIARTIEGLRAHQERHRALGHGFGFTVIHGEETRIPVVPKAYHKINSGPFVQTPWGLRLLRLPEIERIHGFQVGTRHYATGVEILGQGVQTNIFKTVFGQLGDWLVASRGAQPVTKD